MVAINTMTNAIEDINWCFLLIDCRIFALNYKKKLNYVFF